MKRRISALAVAAAAAAWMLAAARGETPPAPGVPVNGVRNGSLELDTNPGYPDGWIGSQWRGEWKEFAISGIPKYVRDMMGAEYPFFTLDTNTAAHGRQSLKLTNPSLRFLRGQWVPVSRDSSPALNTEHTLSFYAKSDPPGMKIKVELQEGGVVREFTLTGEWTRYVFAYTQPRKFQSLIFFAGTPGTYWLDAVQLEPGAEAHPYVDRQ